MSLHFRHDWQYHWEALLLYQHMTQWLISYWIMCLLCMYYTVGLNPTAVDNFFVLENCYVNLMKHLCYNYARVTV